MKKVKTTGKPVTTSMLKMYVTRAEFKKAITDLSKRDDALSRSIVGLHQAMMEGFTKINGKFSRVDQKFDEMNEKMDKKFNEMYSHIDAFMKRTEDNKLEITFLGRQHDDLAKYCTEKIGYPVYGRNL